MFGVRANLIALAIAQFKPRTKPTRLEPREYMVQVRTRNTAGGWTSWYGFGELLTGYEADEWLKLRRDLGGSRWVEYRMVMVARNHPVF